MEIEKPVLQQSSTDPLKCYRDLSFNSSLPPLHHHPDTSKVETINGVDNMIDNDNSDNVGSDYGIDINERRKRSYQLLKKAKTESNDDNDERPSSAIIKHFSDFADEEKEQRAATTAVPDFDYPEFPSPNDPFSITQAEISRRSHAFVASSDSDVNSNSTNSIQEEIPRVKREDSEIFPGKAKHFVSSLYSSSLLRQQHRRSAINTTTPSLLLQSSKILDPAIPFDDDNLRIHNSNYDNGANNLDNPDRTLGEKRPRIERPRARYPNSVRRTSAPACLWSTSSLFPDQVIIVCLSHLLLTSSMFLRYYLNCDYFLVFNNVKG